VVLACSAANKQHIHEWWEDVPIWRWTASNFFTVKSVYDHLTRDDKGLPYNRVWRAKIAEKIKIFMWLIERKYILTKDNMVWKGNGKVTVDVNDYPVTPVRKKNYDEIYDSNIWLCAVRHVKLVMYMCGQIIIWHTKNVTFKHRHVRICLSDSSLRRSCQNDELFSPHSAEAERESCIQPWSVEARHCVVFHLV
jgi:hypothetical protein